MSLRLYQVEVRARVCVVAQNPVEAMGAIHGAAREGFLQPETFEGIEAEEVHEGVPVAQPYWGTYRPALERVVYRSRAWLRFRSQSPNEQVSEWGQAVLDEAAREAEVRL